MSKHIQAYFRTEDDAEGARSRLVSFSVEHLEVGRIAEDLGASRNLLIPTVPFGSTAGMYSGGAQATTNVSAVFMTQNPSVTRVENASEAQRDIHQDRPEDLEVGLGEYPVSDRDYEGEEYRNLAYVLSGKVSDEDCDEVVKRLRSEGGYVEVLE